MPYIKPEDREILDSKIDEVVKLLNATYATTSELIGPVNYTLSRICLGALKHVCPYKLNYADLATFSGMIQNMYSEFYSRVMQSYEKTKQEANGDLREFLYWY